jgi:hypothetical protein
MLLLQKRSTRRLADLAAVTRLKVKRRLVVDTALVDAVAGLRLDPLAVVAAAERG